MLNKQPADDLFEQSSMTFGEHLEALRVALIKASLWLAGGTIIGMLFANQIVLAISTPMKQAILDFQIAEAIKSYKLANDIPEDVSAGVIETWMRETQMMPEKVFVDPKSLSPDTDGIDVDALPPVARSAEVSPWESVDTDRLKQLKPFILWRPISNNLTALTATEPFMIWLKAGLVAGVVIGSPGIFYHIWQFFAAGLYPHERRYVYWYLPLSLVLFLAGIALAFTVVFRLVLGFLMTYTVGMDVDFAPRLNDYMSFALFLPLGFGAAFQLPVVMLGLQRFGIVGIETFAKQWRIAVLAIAFLSMVLTPADPYSMLIMFFPLTALYFLGIALCHYMPTGSGVGSPEGYDPE